MGCGILYPRDTQHECDDADEWEIASDEEDKEFRERPKAELDTKVQVSNNDTGIVPRSR